MLLAAHETVEYVSGVHYVSGNLTHTVWQGTIAEPKGYVAVAVATEGDAERLRRALSTEYPDIPFVVAPVGSFPQWVEQPTQEQPVLVAV